VRARDRADGLDMPTNAAWKKKVRARMALTGESYTQAMRVLQQEIVERERLRAQTRHECAQPARPTSPLSIEWRAPTN
jgi:hypothetical protein